MGIFKKAKINLITICTIGRSLDLGIRSHGLVIRSLDLHNSFIRIAICSLDNITRSLRLQFVPLHLNNAIELTNCLNRRNKLQSDGTSCVNRGNELQILCEFITS